MNKDFSENSKKIDIKTDEPETVESVNSEKQQRRCGRNSAGGDVSG